MIAGLLKNFSTFFDPSIFKWFNSTPKKLLSFKFVYYIRNIINLGKKISIY